VTRRVLIAIFATLFVLMVSSWGVSYWRVHGVRDVLARCPWFLLSENGVVLYERASVSLPGSPALSAMSNVAGEVAGAGRYPAYVSWSGTQYVWRASVPWYLPTAIVGGLLAAAILWPKRRPPGTCRCGYDLTGNVSGTCPECGRRMGIVKRGEPGA
jgi:hypothetical protein